MCLCVIYVFRLVGAHYPIFIFIKYRDLDLPLPICDVIHTANRSGSTRLPASHLRLRIGKFDRLVGVVCDVYLFLFILKSYDLGMFRLRNLANPRIYLAILSKIGRSRSAMLPRLSRLRTVHFCKLTIDLR